MTITSLILIAALAASISFIYWPGKSRYTIRKTKMLGYYYVVRRNGIWETLETRYDTNNHALKTNFYRTKKEALYAIKRIERGTANVD